MAVARITSIKDMSLGGYNRSLQYCIPVYSYTHYPPPQHTPSVILLCLVGVIFPLGFSTVELGGRPFLLPDTYSIGYSYILFNIAIVTCITALLATNRFFACRLLRR